MENEKSGGGCGVILVGLLVIGLLAAALISLGALVDPFSWMPSVGQIWRDCDETRQDCDLAARFPGFWPHLIANLGYVLVAAIALGVLAGDVDLLRRSGHQRFDSAATALRHRTARAALRRSACFAAALAAVPTAFGAFVVGGTVSALVLLALVAAAWPYERHELEAAWRAARPDAADETEWDRYAAWADPAGEEVEIALLCRHPGGWFSCAPLRRVDAEDIEEAAAAMTAARATAEEREFAARQAHFADLARAEQRAHERDLEQIDTAAQADIDAREAALHPGVRAYGRAQPGAPPKAPRRP